MKKFVSIMLAAALFLTMASCGGAPGAVTASPGGAQSSAAPSGAASPEKVAFTDSAGRKVEVPAKITRIAASGAMAQIVLFALAPDMLVGVASKWSDSARPYIDKKYLDLPVIGQFYGSGDLNLEEVAALAPDVIIDVGEPKSTIVEDMDGIQKQVGIPVVHIDASLATMGDAYRALGRLLGLGDRAEELASYCEEVYRRTADIAERAGSKVRLVYCLGDDGLNVLARGSYHAEVIDMLADNAAVVDSPSAKGSGNPVDIEQLLNWDPDVIVFAPDSAYDTVGKDPAWLKLKAVSGGRYYKTPSGPYNWMGYPPSVNRYLGMIWLSKLLYPDIADYDLYEEVSRYYKLFYHCDLTREQYGELVKGSLGK